MSLHKNSGAQLNLNVFSSFPASDKMIFSDFLENYLIFSTRCFSDGAPILVFASFGNTI